MTLAYDTIRVYNTLTRVKEAFRTVAPGRVGMYVCGPTVYAESHIGHMVGPVVFDAVRRHLTYSGYEVTWVVNITDIDDQLIDRVRSEGASERDVADRVRALADRITADYVRCLEALGVDGITNMPRVSDHIPDIIRITRGLVDKGFAYEAGGGDVYFDVSKAPGYGRLSGRRPSELLAGARVATGAQKRHPADFVLWKGAKPGEPSWDSPWGLGRPGWHIECSVMSMELLGEQFDIHGGGLDLVFPHHENEIAQSESYTGKPFATYWMHNGLLTRDGVKISKSRSETVIRMGDLLRKYPPDTLRYLILSSHYRHPTDYSDTRLDELSRSLLGFHHFFERFRERSGESFYKLEAPARRDEGDAAAAGLPAAIKDRRDGFLAAMDDDFNTAGAIGELYELLRSLNRFLFLDESDGDDRPDGRLRAGAAVLRELAGILGLFRAPESGRVPSPDGQLVCWLMELAIELRGRARSAGDFELADHIRKRLREKGIALDDRPGVTTWRREPTAG